MDGVSRSRVDRVGDDLRRYLSGELELSVAELDEHISVVYSWRESHRKSMLSVLEVLVEWAPADDENVLELGRRLKRLPRILEKLVRFPKMRLSRMGDIAGCRVVLTGIQSVDRVALLIESHLNVRKVLDYRVEGKPISGYRALHYLIAAEDRLVEIQLRTQYQHAWAEVVERLSDSIGQALKDGEGPTDLLEYLRTRSETLWLRDSHLSVPKELEQKLAFLQQRLGSTKI